MGWEFETQSKTELARLRPKMSSTCPSTIVLHFSLVQSQKWKMTNKVSRKSESFDGIFMWFDDNLGPLQFLFWKMKAKVSWWPERRMENASCPDIFYYLLLKLKFAFARKEKKWGAQPLQSNSRQATEWMGHVLEQPLPNLNYHKHVKSSFLLEIRK